VLHVRVVGPGRAGCSLVAALEQRGVPVLEVLGRGDDLSGAARGVDVVVIATPDDAVAEVAAAIEPVPGTALVHLAGSLGLDVLQPHRRRASLHPLVPLPDPDIGSRRLLAGITCAVEGDPVAAELAGILGAHVRHVPGAARPAYHAAACVAANHLVALMGQVDRLARQAGLTADDFVGLAAAALEDVVRVGPVEALTGPAARGDKATVERHRAVLARLHGAAADACGAAGSDAAGWGGDGVTGLDGVAGRTVAVDGPCVELAAYDACAGLARALAADRMVDRRPEPVGAG